MEGFVTRFTDYQWSEWIRSPEMDAMIQNGIQSIGVFYLICALFTLIIKPNWGKRLALIVYSLGAFSLIFLASLYCKEKFYHTGQFLEYSIQWSLPLLFYFTLYHDWKSKLFENVLKLVIACTFLGHGLYALGYYPVPGNFVQMTLSIFPFFTESTAKVYLMIAGVLDLLAVPLLFLNKTVKPALIYCIIWGFLTALARVVSGFYPEFWIDSLDQWLPETLYRLGHGGVPLVLYLVLKTKKAFD